MQANLGYEKDYKKAVTWLEKHLDKKSVVNLTVKRKKRSLKQSAYLHVGMTIFATEQGWTLEEAKSVLKRKYGLDYEKKGNKFLRSTADLNTKEMTNFIEWLLIYASKEHGIDIPTPQEYLDNQFNIDAELLKFESYLK